MHADSAYVSPSPEETRSFLSSLRKEILSMFPWFSKKRPSPSYTPVDRLPTAILIEVFSRCSATHTQLPLSWWDRHQDAKFYISQVCRRWRRTVLSMPQLWTNYSIRQPSQSASQNAISSLHTWLSASDNHPITLRLDNVDRQLTSCVVKYIHRCKGLLLVVRRDSAWHMLELFRNPLLQLETFSLETGDNIYNDILSHISFSNWQNWSSLRVLNWDCINVPYLLPEAAMPRLEAVDLRGPISIHRYLTFLRGCTSLQMVTLDGVTFSRDDVPLYNSTIEFLDIKCNGDPLEILQFFTLPSLEQLCLTRRGTSPEHSYDLLTAFVHRSSCQVRYLTISEAAPEDHFAGYITLPCLQDVEVLSIINEELHSGITDETLEFLRYPMKRSRHGYMPRLCSIEMRNLVTTDGLLAEIVASRYEGHREWTEPAQLEDIRAIFAGYHSPLEEESFHKLNSHSEDYMILASFAKHGLHKQAGFKIDLLQYSTYTCWGRNP
ncbi:hypothetical protein DXG01_003390 [Tephrocybe rancida]|nr:hypothetical protein DXG01_003390 [Tephrocybe rancida]